MALFCHTLKLRDTDDERPGIRCGVLQVDLIDFSGPAFKTVDNRVAALRLVQKELCDAALFDPTGELPKQLHSQNKTSFADARLKTAYLTALGLMQHNKFQFIK